MRSPEPVNPYLPPAVRPVKGGEGMAGPVIAGREEAIERAFQLLKSGKDQWAVIDDLRVSGLSAEEAKRESYPVFDGAKRRLATSQFPRRVVALMLIVTGLLIPLGLLSNGGRYLLLPVAPVIVGMAAIFKLPNPKRIHPDLLLGPGSSWNP